MAKCNLCGAKIMPYYDICTSCSSKMEDHLGGFQERVVAAQFMREMGINLRGD